MSAWGWSTGLVQPVSQIACISVSTFFILNVHILAYLGSREVFFVVSADCRLVQIHNILICNTNLLELYTHLVFLVSIRLVFLSIYQTDKGGKHGRYILVLFFLRKPLFSLKRGSWPPFWGAQPPFWGKTGFPPNLKEFLPNCLVLKYRPKYQLTSTSIWYIDTNTGQAASIKTIYNARTLHTWIC